VIPETLNWPIDPYLVGGIVMAVGLLLAAVGFQVKRSSVERQRDRMYVRQQRGDAPLPDEPPRIATVLEHLGGAVALIGAVLLLAAWSTSTGQS
jgi:hypothetical protein